MFSQRYTGTRFPIELFHPYDHEMSLLTRLKTITEMENRWLSVDEIGRYLGVSNDTVYRWIDKHAMPAHRMGRLWKFQKDEVDQWVKAGGASDQSKNEA